MFENDDGLIRKLLSRMNERAKELNCIYSIEEALRRTDNDTDTVLAELVALIPYGWQYPSVCEARISIGGKVWTGPDFRESPWKQSAEIVADNHILGSVEVFYLEMIREVKGSQFLPEEQKLLNTIAERIGDYFFFKKLRNTVNLIHDGDSASPEIQNQELLLSAESDEHWKWRLHMASLIAERMDMEGFGVNAIYVLGSVKNACSGPGSDIDLMIHLEAEDKPSAELVAWLEGWSLCLAEMNYQKTGYDSSEGLLDVHYITDEDIANGNSYAIKIKTHTDAARLLRKK